MREEDVRIVIDDLVQLLQSPDIGLGELVEQHLDAVANGLIIEVDADDTPHQPSKAENRKLPPGDVRHRDLTVDEQLSGLLDLIEVAVAGTIDVEERTVEMAREFLPKDGDPTIRFSYDPANTAGIDSSSEKKAHGDEIRVVTLPAPSRKNAAREILDTLRQLREVTNVSRADWLEPQEERLHSTLPGWRNR